MKRKFYLGIFIVLVSVIISTNYKTAYGEEDNSKFDYYIFYDEEDEESGEKWVEIHGYNGNEENLVIPEEIEGCKVTEVRFSESDENDFVKTITLPSGVSRYSFSLLGLPSLTDIYVSEDNESLVSEAGIVYDKTDNTLIAVPQARQGTINIKEGTTGIDYGAFINCKNVTEINIPASVDSFGGSIFLGCGVKDIKIDENNKEYSVKDGMICNKQGNALRVYPPYASGDITIPDYINRIEMDAFGSVRGINKLVLLPSVKEIDNMAFMNAEIKEIVLPEGIKTIPHWAFAYNSILEKVNIPSTVTEIADMAFMGCYSLSDITIPANVKKIGEDAFRSVGCKNIYIESRIIDEIGENAFYSWEEKNIYVHDENTYNLINNEKYISDSTKVILIKDAEPLELDKYEVTLYTGNTKKSAQVKAVLTDIKGTVKWTTSDKSVATVKNGKITAVKKGKAVITASVAGHKKKVKVTVKNPQIIVADGSESINTINVKRGKTDFYRVSVNPSKSGIKLVTTKNSKKYAKISLKKNTLSLKGIKKGTFTFKLQSGKGSKTVKVKVS